MIGGKFPTGHLREVIEQSSRVFSIDRVTDTPDETQFGSSRSYTEDATTADIYVYQPREQPQFVPEGRVTSGGLEGLCLPSEDVQLEDRIEYAGGTWEVSAKTPIDVGGDTLAYQLTFDRVQL